MTQTVADRKLRERDAQRNALVEHMNSVSRRMRTLLALLQEEEARRYMMVSTDIDIETLHAEIIQLSQHLHSYRYTRGIYGAVIQLTDEIRSEFRDEASAAAARRRAAVSEINGNAPSS